MTVAQAATLAQTPPQPADDAPHLLLVDDDRRIRDLLSRFLCGEGYRVTTAMSAKDARAKLLGLHFDMLILDVMMPGETGFDLARFIRTSSSVPIIMLTARHEAKAGSRACRSAPTIMSPSRSNRASWCCGSAISSSAPRRRRWRRWSQVAFGPYVFHLERGELRQGEEVVHLTDRERDMLRVLAATPGETVPRGALTGGDGTAQRARGRRADQPAATQDRARSRQPAVPAGGARHRLSPGRIALRHLQ